jgi:hypothetical protein
LFQVPKKVIGIRGFKGTGFFSKPDQETANLKPIGFRSEKSPAFLPDKPGIVLF